VSSSDKHDNPQREPGWERGLVERLATEALVEKRRARRWGIFFKFLTFAYLLAVLLLWLPREWSERSLVPGKHTALVELKGVIAPGEQAGAETVIKGLRAAFKDKKTKGVILRINSPGGTPVQASYISGEIRRLRKKYPDTPLYAVVSDVCASGGYYVAVAADKIYVNESSIVGSIGVLISSFGFVDTLDKLGVQRRLLTAGDHKGILDPFSPMKEFDREHLQQLLDQMHAKFIQVVREGRGDRLKEQDDLFSGLFWSGEESVRLGLADDFGSAGYVAREVIGAEDIVDFTEQEDVLERLADRLGAATARVFAGLLGADGTPRLQ